MSSEEDKLVKKIVRKGTNYQSYRFSIPKAIIEVNNWQNKKFKLEVKDKKVFKFDSGAFLS